MRNIWWVSAILVLALVGLARAEGDAAPALADNDAVLGQATAPVTIFEYASLTCPHCAEFDAETFPKVKEEWIDTGKARLIYRDYPLDQAALKAAVLARCAPPDRFYSFIDVLFHSQTNWAMSGDVEQALSRIARLGGISEDKFDACMKDQTLIDRVVAERLVAQKQYDVNSTPTFFINGKKLVGALPYAEFSKALSAATADLGTSHYAAASRPEAASE
jgi:protein-disulfide isomerase